MLFFFSSPKHIKWYVLLKSPDMTTIVTVSKLTTVNILLSKDDSRIPHAIKTKKKKLTFITITLKCIKCSL